MLKRIGGWKEKRIEDADLDFFRTSFGQVFKCGRKGRFFGWLDGWMVKLLDGFMLWI